MKPTRRMFLTFLILSLSLGICYAQKERNVWCFGMEAEIDFNSGTPVSDSGCAIGSHEGSASIADKNTGQLLFYTNGYAVANRDNNIMPHCTIPLGGSPTTTQSAFILPMPGNSNKYYIFCTDAQAGIAGGTGGDSGTQYCIIDMDLDGGLGDIEQQPIPLLKPTCEKIAAAVMPDSQGYWVVLHLWNSDAFYAYPVTEAGIGIPVISHIGIVHEDNLNFLYGTGSGAIGYMRISSDGSKIAVAIFSAYTAQVFNFSNITGLISSTIFSDTNFEAGANPYGLCFSPNSQLLYVSDYIGIYQYNLLAGNDSAILGSKTLVSNNNAYALQLGPDQKIYIAIDGGHFLDRINDPDSVGAACAYELNAVQLIYGQCGSGLPEFPPEMNKVSTGVNEVKEEQVLLYPNPCATASVQLAVSSELIGSRLAVYDIQGQLVFTSAIRNPQSEIPVSGLAAGVYFVQVSSANSSLVRKLVKIN